MRNGEIEYLIDGEVSKAWTEYINRIKSVNRDFRMTEEQFKSNNYELTKGFYNEFKDYIENGKLVITKKLDENVDKKLKSRPKLESNQLVKIKDKVEPTIQQNNNIEVSNQQTNQLSNEQLNQIVSSKTDDIKFNSSSDEYKWLSNFQRLDNPIVDDLGNQYWTNEAYYQAMKTLDNNERQQFTYPTISGNEAKQLGKSVTLQPNWDNIKVNVMREGLRQKFNNNPELMNKLKNTTQDLVEWNNWGDKFFGITNNDNQGKNVLGKLLMELRDNQSKTTDNNQTKSNIEQSTTNQKQRDSRFETTEQDVYNSMLNVIKNLSDKLGVAYEIDETMNVGGRFKNGKVYFNPNKMNSETVWHEFSHPFIQAVKRFKPELYDNLVQEIYNTPYGQLMMNEVQELYSDKSKEIQEEEAIVELIARYSTGRITNEEIVNNKSLWDKLIEFLRNIGSLIFKNNSNDLAKQINVASEEELFQNPIRIYELNNNLSLKELSEILKYGGVLIKTEGEKRYDKDYEKVSNARQWINNNEDVIKEYYQKEQESNNLSTEYSKLLETLEGMTNSLMPTYFNRIDTYLIDKYPDNNYEIGIDEEHGYPYYYFDTVYSKLTEIFNKDTISYEMLSKLENFDESNVLNSLDDILNTLNDEGSIEFNSALKKQIYNGLINKILKDTNRKNKVDSYINSFDLKTNMQNISKRLIAIGEEMDSLNATIKDGTRYNANELNDENLIVKHPLLENLKEYQFTASDLNGVYHNVGAFMNNAGMNSMDTAISNIVNLLNNNISLDLASYSGLKGLDGTPGLIRLKFKDSTPIRKSYRVDVYSALDDNKYRYTGRNQDKYILTPKNMTELMEYAEDKFDGNGRTEHFVDLNKNNLDSIYLINGYTDLSNELKQLSDLTGANILNEQGEILYQPETIVPFEDEVYDSRFDDSKELDIDTLVQSYELNKNLQIYYVASGLGKTELSKSNPNKFKDMDEIINQAIQNIMNEDVDTQEGSIYFTLYPEVKIEVLRLLEQYVNTHIILSPLNDDKLSSIGLRYQKYYIPNVNRMREIQSGIRQRNVNSYFINDQDYENIYIKPYLDKDNTVILDSYISDEFSNLDNTLQPIQEYVNLNNQNIVNNTLYIVKDILINEERFKLNKVIDIKLSKIIVDYLKPFGITFEKIQDLNNKGYSNSYIVDTLSKLALYVDGDKSESNITDAAGHLIFELIGRNSEFGQLILNKIKRGEASFIKTTQLDFGDGEIIETSKKIDKYKEAIEKFKDNPNYYKEGNLNEDKIAIHVAGELIAESLKQNYDKSESFLNQIYNFVQRLLNKLFKGSIDNMKQTYEDDNKGLLGGFLKAARQTQMNSLTLKNITDFISANVLLNKDKFLDISIPDNYVHHSFEDSMNNSPELQYIHNKILNSNYADKIGLTGSVAFRKTGTVYRPNDEYVHDIDYIVSHDIANNFDNIIKEIFPNAVLAHGLWNDDNTKSSTTAYYIPIGDNAKIKDYKINEKDYLDSNGNKDFMIGDIVMENQNDSYIGVDFFLSQGIVNEVIENGVVRFDFPFIAKIGYGRNKDVKDFRNFKLFNPKSNTALFQQPDYIYSSDEDNNLLESYNQSKESNQSDNLQINPEIANPSFTYQDNQSELQLFKEQFNINESEYVTSKLFQEYNNMKQIYNDTNILNSSFADSLPQMIDYIKQCI